MKKSHADFYMVRGRQTERNNENQRADWRSHTPPLNECVCVLVKAQQKFMNNIVCVSR